MIGEIPRARGVATLSLRVLIPVLHPDRYGEVGAKRVVDVSPSLLLEDRADGVEIPVAIELIGAMRFGSARRSGGQVVSRVRRGVIHTRACGKEVADGGLSLAGQQPANVIEVQLRERLVELHLPVGHVVTEQHGENALPNRSEITECVEVTVLEDDLPAGHRHQASRRGL